MSFRDKFEIKLSPSTIFASPNDFDAKRRVNNDNNNNNICLLDHDYGLPGTPAGGYVKKSAVKFRYCEDGDCEDDCVEIRPYSVLREHSYSIANLFSSKNVLCDEGKVVKENQSEIVLEDVFTDILGE